MSRSRLAGFTSRVMMLGAAGLLVLSYLSIVVNPASAWVLVVFGLLFVPLALLNLFLLLWAVKRRSGAFVIPLLALLPSLFFAGRYIQFSGSEKTADGDAGPSFRIVSYNVGRFSMMGNSRENTEACMDSVVSFLRENDPDIICLQEFRVDNLSSIRPFLASAFRGYEPVWYFYTGEYGCYGNVTLSRFPVRGKGKLIFDRSANLAIYTDVMVGDSLLRIYNCHFESYSISLEQLVKSLGRDRGILKETETKMRRSIGRRPRQVDQVFRHIAESPVEALICGDFNDSPMSYTYYKMKKGREDSFVQAGNGFGATYSTLWPLLRIDYILYPKEFAAVGHRTPKVPFSDHYPVIAEIDI